MIQIQSSPIVLSTASKKHCDGLDLKKKKFPCADDLSLGSGRNGSFDDRTEGSSLHEGNR